MVNAIAGIRVALVRKLARPAEPSAESPICVFHLELPAKSSNLQPQIRFPKTAYVTKNCHINTPYLWAQLNSEAADKGIA